VGPGEPPSCRRRRFRSRLLRRSGVRHVISLDCTQPDKFLSAIANVSEHLYPRPKVLILNYRHPSTTVVERDFYVEVVRLAKRYGFMVNLRFRLRDVCFDGYQAPSFLSVPGAKDVGVETTTMSKGYSMAGWRLGFCAGNAEMVRAPGDDQGYYDYGIFQAVQVAAIVALRDGDEAVRRQATEYQSRRDVLVEGLRRIGWEMASPKAACSCGRGIPRRGSERWGRSSSA